MKYVIANWKMNLGIRESVALARGTLHVLQGKERVPEIILCPSATALSEVRKTLARTRMHLGAQNVGPGRAGAFTGEIGVAQLEDVGCTYVVIGHSERRTMGETDKLIGEKIKAVFESSPVMTPILCVGESAQERSAGKTEDVLRLQLENVLKDVSFSRRRKLIVAYEPVWAIGSGMTPSPADVMALNRMVKKTAINMTGAAPDQIPVLYGGSVDATNAYAFLREPDIDGLLVGGASLKIHDIHAIIQSACDVMAQQDDSVWS